MQRSIDSIPKTRRKLFHARAIAFVRCHERTATNRLFSRARDIWLGSDVAPVMIAGWRGERLADEGAGPPDWFATAAITVESAETLGQVGQLESAWSRQVTALGNALTLGDGVVVPDLWLPWHCSLLFTTVRSAAMIGRTASRNVREAPSETHRDHVLVVVVVVEARDQARDHIITPTVATTPWQSKSATAMAHARPANGMTNRRSAFPIAIGRSRSPLKFYSSLFSEAEENVTIRK